MILKEIYTTASVRAVEWKLWGSDTVETKGLCFELGTCYTVGRAEGL